MSGWTFPSSSGIELTENAIRIALGEPPGSLAPVWHRTSAERAAISIPGVVEEITGVGEVRADPHVAELFLTVSPGTTVRFPQSNVEKCANVIAVHEERTPACRHAEAAIARMEVVLTPGNQESARFLFTEQQHVAYPSAYRASLERATPASLSEFYKVVAKASNERPMIAATTGTLGEERDWAYRTLQETVETLTSADLVSLGSRENSAGRIVWWAILKGGLQGGRYAARSIART